MNKILMAALLALTGFALSGCAAKPRTALDKQNDYYAARTSVVITGVEPAGCQYIKSQQTEGLNYDSAILNIKSYAASARANTAVIDQIDNVANNGMQHVRLSARLFYCP